MKKTEGAWNERVAKDRPNARSQPKFPWQVKPISGKDQEEALPRTGTEKGPVTGAEKGPVTGAEKGPVAKTGAEKGPVTKAVTGAEKGPVATFRIPHQELDYLFRELDPGEFKLYLKLFRLSHGWGREICCIGDGNLIETLNMSKNSLRSAKRSLMDKQLIEIIRTVNQGPNGYTEYCVLRTGEQIKSNWYQKGTSSENITGTEKGPVKTHDHDHDHDLNHDLNHHQKETMMIYQTITGNKWKKSDDEAYKKIKEVPLEKIGEGIRLATKRSASRPNSLNYFVKEITNLAHPSEQSKTQRKKALEKIVARVRDNNVGAADYKLPDFV